MTLSVCVAQLNFVVGDVRANAQKIIQAAHAAYAQGARLLLTGELSICGYAAEDLLLRPSFIEACDTAVEHIARELAMYPDLHVVVGHPIGGDVRDRSVTVTQRFNVASVLYAGQVCARAGKRELANYQVFDEKRYFAPSDAPPCVVEVHGVRVGLLICEDAWFDTAARECQQAGAHMLAVINASPFHVGKAQEREVRMAQRAQDTALPLVYAHLVGGQDEVVFDGASFACQHDGSVAARAVSFGEQLFFVQGEQKSPQAGFQWTAQSTGMVAGTGVGVGVGVGVGADTGSNDSETAQLWQALVLGLRDYVNKNHFPSVILGLSGGIDSALVLSLAVDALGCDKVRTVMMPSPYTADISWLDARDMAQRVGVKYEEISIAPLCQAFEHTLAAQLAGTSADTTEENIQARVRGTLLMALSNKFGALVLTTGNKSELATGYCTLYGDMAGGFAPIKDVVKTRVYALARWRNQHDPLGTGSNPIPERIITRAPSAELRPNQTDQDSLPAYDVLDAIVQRYMEQDQSVAEIVAAGFEASEVRRVVRLIHLNEYKRRQAPVGLRVTHRSFGKDWRYPITQAYQAV